jgi:hypothetical protein
MIHDLARVLVRASAWMRSCLCLLLAAGCASTGEESWHEGSVVAPTERVLWQVTVLALERNAFPVGSGVNPSTLKAVSGWRVSLAPFKGDGYREQAHIEWTRDEAQAGRWNGRVRVHRQRNENLSKPLDISYAEWEDDPDDLERARLLFNTVKALLGGEFKVEAREPRSLGG